MMPDSEKIDPPPQASRTPYVAVVGPGEASTHELRQAEQVGVLLALRRAVILCGGLGGVMEAACKGAALHGGHTVGFLPGRDRAAGNPFLTITLPTGLGELRNGLVVGSADAVIAVGGSWGTLSEISLAMRTGKPTFVLGGWKVDTNAQAAGASSPREVSSAEEAVDGVFAMLGI
ncbi:TIGR00725 family protein [Actinospica durhamensis]|uniref:TIGR00725 family protein n=1 Tax=Actinospica durhamensis TaxID=1508375 RepID=A0A941F0A7_9ACTN|nr:TIGR00725 family protein [Actinospica durhamensis]MBR7838974.1 TIGR00725 family protein [Actinospica durhamensis]